MYLKNLTILGFKSFADKTTLNFMPGITAIVGPNGCGKSNVADSIRWVVGEQSAKALRGGEMADVIFNGADSRKPLSMAEVSLTMGDIDEGQLRAAGVDIAYDEVTVTRRVFRDGSSEYFINKIPCRLKDIQQLFMGTGVGRASYSIMAQGHITQLLSSRPEDRRMVFEEAAGITRFKTQKKEALRKLESTEQNLLRLTDLIREVKRQIGSLQRQAGKARRYKQFMVELQHLDCQLARHQFDVLQAEIKDRQTNAEKLRIETEVCSESVLREEDELGRLRARMTELEQEISASQQQGLELKGQADQHESRIHFNEQRLQELENQNSKALGDIAQGEERRQVAEHELESLKERFSASMTGVEQLRVVMQEKREAMQQIENGLRERQEALRKAQSDSFNLAQQLTRARNEINALEMQKQGNAGRLEKLSSEKVQLEEERIRLETRLTEFATNVEADKISLQAHRGTVEEKQERLRQIQPELAQLTKTLDEALRQQAGLRSRMNVLEQLQAAHEGFSAGTMAALKQAPHMLGVLVDKIRVPDNYIAPIEAALGYYLQLVLTDQPETARQILADLRANRKGRASIASLALQKTNNSVPATAPVPAIDHSASAKPTPESTPSQSEASGTAATAAAQAGLADATISSAGQNTSISEVSTACATTPQQTEMSLGGALAGVSALSVIEADDTVKTLLERLLGRTLIVSDLATATEVWRARNGEWDVVTADGEMLSRHGVYTGGSGGNSEKSAASILGRKNQIAELETQLAQLQEQVNTISRSKGALQSEQTELQAGLQEAQSELRVQEVAIATRQGEFRALENAARLLHQKIDTVVYEIQSLAEQAQENQVKREALGTQAGALEIRDQELLQQVAEGNKSLEDLRQQRETANGSLTETKVTLASEEQLSNSLRQQVQSQEQRIGELTHLVDVRRQEIETIVERRDQLQTEIQESQTRMESLRHERELINAGTASLVGQKQELDADITQRDTNLKERRRRLADVQQQRGAIDVELAQKTMAVQNLRERIQQKYQLNLDDVRSECITITIADEGAPKVETLTPEEMANRGLATDWTAVAGQVAALQKRIDDIGPVNLVAIDEYEETEQRYQFLTTQHDDLAKAKEQLLEVINRINTQTQEMFTETFNKVRANFQVLFTEIFGGGKADLQLTNEGDVLESGIDIMARPPGKQLRSITLLSGGEQTMTAVALLFAIYQVKPSPFCVLDELDAPLDESNINRFIGVLMRFVQQSQFIMITHNKRTIGTASVIYGVTMQEHGVSKMVSMKFQKSTGTLTPQPTATTTVPVSVSPMAGGELPVASRIGGDFSAAGPVVSVGEPVTDTAESSKKDNGHKVPLADKELNPDSASSTTVSVEMSIAK
jgi:chromosome segregation protein